MLFQTSSRMHGPSEASSRMHGPGETPSGATPPQAFRPPAPMLPPGTSRPTDVLRPPGAGPGTAVGPRAAPPIPPRVPHPGAAPISPTSPDARTPGSGSSSSNPSETPNIDWATVVTLRRQAADLIAGRAAEWSREHATPMPELDRRLMGRSLIRACVRDRVQQLHGSGQALWSLDQEHAYAHAVEDAIFGYGRLQPLFEQPTAENIEINGFADVFIQDADGRRRPHPPVADSDEELVEAIRFLGQTASPPRPFDDAHPMMTLALGDRFRLHAIGFGLADKPSITIRQHLLTDVSLADLADKGMMTRQLAEFLTSAVQSRLSIVISGDQGAGKTTLLRALIAAIPDAERFGTLETDYELLAHLKPGRHVVALQARSGMGERVDGHRVGEYSVADLMPEALRQNLTRLIVGEVRGPEAAAMFEAMQAGAGTMSTTHAHSAASTIDRLASRVAQGGVLTTDEAYRQIAYNVGLVIHVRLVDDAWRGGSRRRFIDEILHITGGIENGRPVISRVFQWDGGAAPSFAPDADLVARLRPFSRQPSPGGGPP